MVEVVFYFFGLGVFLLVLGGGYEIVWGSYLGFCWVFGIEVKIGIVNIDVYFDF